MSYTEFNKTNLQNLRFQLEKVLKEHGPEGIEFSLGNIKFSATECKIGLEAKIAGAVKRSSSFLEKELTMMGLVSENKQGWKLVDYKRANWKMPFIFEKLDGKRYKCSSEQAQIYFAK